MPSSKRRKTDSNSSDSDWREEFDKEIGRSSRRQNKWRILEMAKMEEEEKKKMDEFAEMPGRKSQRLRERTKVSYSNRSYDKMFKEKYKSSGDEKSSKSSNSGQDDDSKSSNSGQDDDSKSSNSGEGSSSDEWSEKESEKDSPEEPVDYFESDLDALGVSEEDKLAILEIKGKSPNMSAYECKRALKLKQNKDMMKQLGLMDDINALKPPPKPAPVKRKPKPKPEIIPRKSTRISEKKETINYYQEETYYRAEVKVPSKAISNKPLKLPVVDISAADSVALAPVYCIMEKFNKTNEKEGSKPDESKIFKSGEIESTKPVSSEVFVEFKPLREPLTARGDTIGLSQLTVDDILKRIVEQNKGTRVRSCKSRIASLAVHSNPEMVLVASGSRDGEVGLTAILEDQIEPVAVRLQGEIDTVGGLKFSKDKLYSCSYEGVCRVLDPITSSYNSLIELSHSFRALDVRSNPSDIIYLAGLQSYQVKKVDARTKSIIATYPEKQVRSYSSLWDVNCHPFDENYFVTATNNGLVILWDERRSDMPVQIQDEIHSKSVNSAVFDTATGDSLLTVSWDNTICRSKFKDRTEFVVEDRMVHDNDALSGGGGTRFRAEWYPNSDKVFVVGSTGTPRKCEFYTSNMGYMQTLTLTDDPVSMPSLVKFHPGTGAIAIGNSSGYVTMWHVGNEVEKDSLNIESNISGNSNTFGHAEVKDILRCTEPEEEEEVRELLKCTEEGIGEKEIEIIDIPDV